MAILLTVVSNVLSVFTLPLVRVKFVLEDCLDWTITSIPIVE